MNNNRGSVWNKWDLHLHTPGTKLNDQFRDSDGNKINESANNKIWNEYCSILNKSGIKCFGITDYFSVENYTYLKENRKKFGLDEDIVLFPNIELRVSGLVPKGKKKSPHKHVNVHVIFSEKISTSELNDFLGNLTTENDKGVKKNFRDHLDDLIKDNSFLHLPHFKNIQTALADSLGHNYREKVLIMVPNGDDGLSTDFGTNHGDNRIFMTNSVNLVQTPNDNDIKYYLDTATKFYNRSIPCISGSDAHDFQSFTNYDLSKSTWIKARKTFEGLKSILFEPASRVKIQQLNPSEDKSSSKIISHIKLPDNEFKGSTLHFNENINAIIGGRSSGKSLLLSLIGMKASGIENIKGHNKNYNDMILEKMEDTELYLENGDIINGNMNIEFFYQDKLQEIARDTATRNEFISSIIVDSDEVNRINKEIDEIKESLNIASIIDIKADLKYFKAELGKLQSSQQISTNIKEIKESISKISIEFTDEELNDIDVQKEKLNEVNKDIKVIENKLQLIDELNTKDIITINNNISNDAELLLKHSKPDLDQQLSTLNTSIFNELNIYRTNLIKEEGIKKVEREAIQKTELMVKYETNKTTTPELTRLNNSLEKEESRLQDRKTFEYKINSLTNDLTLQNENFLNKIKWGNFDKSIKVLSESSLSVEYNTSINQDKIINIFTKNIKTSLMKYKEIAADSFKNIINIEILNYQALQPDDFNTTISNIIISEDDSLFKSGYSLESFLTDLIRLDHISKDYKLEYEGQTFDRMSEGKRAFVLLLLKLKIGEEDCPILIDQPEDNLDNRSIATQLVQYLKEEKLKRQIFIVTHNANVTIGSDSENVIIANEHDELHPNPNNAIYHYINGSLENNAIREKVCLILEGGVEAFKAREHRYNFDL